MTRGALNYPPERVWAAEDRANHTLRNMVEPVEHRCGNCYSSLGKSALRCRNEPS